MIGVEPQIDLRFTFLLCSITGNSPVPKSSATNVAKVLKQRQHEKAIVFQTTRMTKMLIPRYLERINDFDSRPEQGVGTRERLSGTGSMWFGAAPGRWIGHRTRTKPRSTPSRLGVTVKGLNGEHLILVGMERSARDQLLFARSLAPSPSSPPSRRRRYAPEGSPRTGSPDRR